MTARAGQCHNCRRDVKMIRWVVANLPLRDTWSQDIHRKSDIGLVRLSLAKQQVVLAQVLQHQTDKTRLIRQQQQQEEVGKVLVSHVRIHCQR